MIFFSDDFFSNFTNWFLSSGVKIIGVLVAAWVFNIVIKKFIKSFLKRVIEVGEDDSKREETLTRIFTGVLSIVVWSIAFITVISELGVDVTGILAGAGIIGVAVGFGAQWMVRDFLAGIFILLENQYRVGDVVCLDDTCGGVEDITLRKTVLRDLDGRLMHIPNGSFKRVANLTKDFSRAHMNISVAYKEDIDRVMEVINRVGKEMAEESPWKEYILKPIQVVGSGPDKFAESAIEIKVLGETKPLKQWNVMREFRRRLKIAFDKEGIEIPFPQISVWPRGKME